MSDFAACDHHNDQELLRNPVIIAPSGPQLLEEVCTTLNSCQSAPAVLGHCRGSLSDLPACDHLDNQELPNNLSYDPCSLWTGWRRIEPHQTPACALHNLVVW